jgi:hypothetical protein
MEAILDRDLARTTMMETRERERRAMHPMPVLAGLSARVFRCESKPKYTAYIIQITTDDPKCVWEAPTLS